MKLELTKEQSAAGDYYYIKIDGKFKACALTLIEAERLYDNAKQEILNKKIVVIKSEEIQ